ncbi:MAG TPA: hemolysin family protein [Lachnospiraceae bacterium]|nr:hemolysin family protein [Lachnospiraceae bacterium]
MEEAGPYLSIIIFVLCLALEFVFYGFGCAIQNLNGAEIERRSLEKKDVRSIRLHKFLETPTQFINTVQLVVTSINIMMGWFYLQRFLEYIEQFTEVKLISIFVTAILLIYVLLTFGVLVPKRLGTRYSEKWAYHCINMIYYITKIMIPFTFLVTISTNGILRLFGLNPDDDLYDVTEEEIISMVNEGHEQGVLQASEAEMITKIFELGDKEAKDIMINRQNMIAIDGNMHFKKAINFMLKERNSRYPVYDENIDHIIGILHLRDAMRIHSANEKRDCPICEIEDLIREVKFIPETRNIDLLFKEMQSSKVQMVIVVDEYGQTSGLVSMEDILEEIVGNILDEYDVADDYIEETGNDEYIIEGMTPLEELEDKLNICFYEDEFDTLNGFLISKLDRIPEENEEFEIEVEGYNFKVLTVENKMIQSVLVTKSKILTDAESPILVEV